MLLNDRLVGSFGTVAPGDRSLIVKVAVAAVRNGFAVVPMQDDTVTPACALTIRDSKKPHECYHVLTEDTKVRPAFQRLTKDGNTCNLAIDIGASNVVVTEEVDSWWVGPEISPTLIGLDGRRYYVFDLDGSTEEDYARLPDNAMTEGTLLVPPTTDDGGTTRVEIVGQINHLSDNKETETEDMTENDRDENTIALAGRIEALELIVADQGQAIDDLRGQLAGLKLTTGKLQEAMITGLTAMKELRDAARSD